MSLSLVSLSLVAHNGRLEGVKLDAQGLSRVSLELATAPLLTKLSCV